VPPSILGDVGDATLNRLSGTVNVDSFTLKNNFSLVSRCKSEDDPGQFRTSTTHDARQANDLTCAYGKVHRVNTRRGATNSTGDEKRYR